MKPAALTLGEGLGLHGIIAQMNRTVLGYQGDNGLVILRVAAQQPGKLRGGQHRCCVQRLRAAINGELHIKTGLPDRVMSTSGCPARAFSRMAAHSCSRITPS